MTDPAATTRTEVVRDPSREWLGHPKGLYVLFFAEMWERFCYYGMRTLLVYYMVAKVVGGPKGGFGYTDAYAFGVYGSYTSLVYCTPILGGLLADRFLGYRAAIILGGIFMALGEFSLLMHKEMLFYAGLAMLVIGNGFFKPNISTIVGKLYPQGDARRDAGFTIFYMGINLGAFLSTMICGYIGEKWGWTYGFGLAGIGMLLGLTVFAFGKNLLHGVGQPPRPAVFGKALAITVLCGALAVPLLALLFQQNEIVGWLLLATGVVVLGSLFATALKEEKAQREQLFVILVLIFFHMTFWAFFEQAGSSLSLFTQRNVDLQIGDWTFPYTWGQSFNPLFIIALAPLFAMAWPALSRRGKEPSTPNKFTLGLLQVGLGFGVLVFGARFAHDGLTPLIFLVLAYFLHTTGELCLSPVGLSMVTKLAPARMTGMVMGAWFLSIAFAQYLAGLIAKLTGIQAEGGEGAAAAAISPTDTLPVYTDVFGQIAIAAIVVGVICFALSPILKRWMHGVK